MRLVAGGRCFYVFQLYRGGLRIKIRVTTVSHKTNSPLCPLSSVVKTVQE